MNQYFKAILGGVSAWVVSQYRHTWLDLIKLYAATLYLRGVQVARNVCRSLVGLAACLLIAFTGFILVHVGLFVLLPSPYNGIVLLVLGFAYLIAGLCGIRRLTSEAWWMQITQGDRCVDAATKSNVP
jgi:hypothetical protein